jgi:hypothetical protein
LPRPQERLISPCPACGKNMGFVTLRRWSRPDYKERLDYETHQKYKDFDSPVMKKTLPYENGTVPDEVSSAMYDAKLATSKEIVFLKTVKYILKDEEFINNYPEITENAVFYGLGMRASTDLMRSLKFSDKRTKLQFGDLLNISMLIMSRSYREVAKKFGVSIKFIKNNESQVVQQAEVICRYMPGYIEFRKKIFQILATDEGIREKFSKYLEGVIHTLVENNIQETSVRGKVNKIRDEINDPKRLENEYYYIIHPKRSDKGVHLSRRIICGPFTEKNLPVDLLLDYWKKKKTKNKVDNEHLKR